MALMHSPGMRWASAALFGAGLGLSGAAAALAQEYVPAHIDPAYPNRQPPYPATAQSSGEQGDVVVNVKVNTNGRVRTAKVDTSSGFADLDTAALDGVMGWRFVPASRAGDTVTAWTKVKIVFQLPTALPAQAKPLPSPP
jgi:protein TonB